MKTFVAPLDKFNSDLWQYHIKVPLEIAEEFIAGNNRRVKCRFNDQEETSAALMPSKAGWYILLNKQIRNKLGIVLGEEVSVSMEKDDSKYGREMPEELAVLLEQDEEGKHFFDSLTMGKQRSLVYIVDKVKNTNSRLNKALAIVHHLKEVQGKLDFKQLNETIKEYNNRGKLKH